MANRKYINRNNNDFFEMEDKLFDSKHPNGRKGRLINQRLLIRKNE